MSDKGFDRAWRNFNHAAGFGEQLTRPAFAQLVLRAPTLFASYVLTAAQAYVESRPENRRYAALRGAAEVTP